MNIKEKKARRLSAIAASIAHMQSFTALASIRQNPASQTVPLCSEGRIYYNMPNNVTELSLPQTVEENFSVIKVRKRPFVGVNGDSRIVVNAVNSLQLKGTFATIYGPFKSQKAADYMANNPNCKKIADAEKACKSV